MGEDAPSEHDRGCSPAGSGPDRCAHQWLRRVTPIEEGRLHAGPRHTASLADDARERGARARAARCAQESKESSSAHRIADGPARPIRAALSGRALTGHAAAPQPPPYARYTALPLADGRAVRRTRRANAHAHAG